MKIAHISLTNWKNFQKLSTPIGERLFIVGPNACGKSNFLDAFRFLHDLAVDGLQKALESRGGLSQVRSLAARQYSNVDFAAKLIDNAKGKVWRYEVSIKQKPHGRRNPFIASERAYCNESILINRPDGEDQQDEMRLTQTHLEQISANKSFRPIHDFFASIRYLHLVPQLVRHAEAFTGIGVPGDPFGRNFIELMMRTPSNTRRSRLRKIEKALKIAIPQLKTLTDTQDELGVPHLEALYEHWRPQGAKHIERHFSDGTLRLIGLLWALFDNESLLLLEEPELSLHDAIVSKLPSLMHRVSQQRKKASKQIIMSTHSAALLSDKGIGGEETLLLYPLKEGTHGVLAADQAQIRRLLESGMSVADAVLPSTAPDQAEQLLLDFAR